MRLTELMCDDDKLSILHTCDAQEAYKQPDRIVQHSELVIFTLRGNFWYQIYKNRRQKFCANVWRL